MATFSTRRSASTVHGRGLSGAWRMDEVMQAYPSAQRALSQKYGIDRLTESGGVVYSPSDSLAAVVTKHGANPSEAIAHIQSTQDAEKELEIPPRDAAELLKAGRVRMLDVREPRAFAFASVPGSELIDDVLATEIVDRWPRDAPIVLVCHHGMRSLDAAHYLRSCGFTNVKSVAGGVDAWSLEIDSAIPRY
jgi:rhodanese-related sulfurtransferase